MYMGDRLVFAMAAALAASGCASRPEITGSALLLNMQPSSRPRLVGAYDFDLLDAVQGSACATRLAAGSDGAVYWFVGADLDKLSSDPLTSSSIRAAVFEALKNTPDADSLVVTRVVAEGHGPDKVCAIVYGRAIRLKKAGEPTPSDREDRDGLASDRL
jgi:type IV pilus biogenesis protein CpaD/CtpE